MACANVIGCPFGDGPIPPVRRPSQERRRSPDAEPAPERKRREDERGEGLPDEPRGSLERSGTIGTVRVPPQREPWEDTEQRQAGDDMALDAALPVPRQHIDDPLLGVGGGYTIGFDGS